MTATVVIGMVTVGIQQVYAPRSCGSCVQFKKLTHEFEKTVIKSIGDPNVGPQPHLTELLQAYSQDVLLIFIGDPGIDEVRTLLQSYEQDVTRIFDINPPDPDKRQLHDQIKEFKQLTHTFRTEVLELAHVGLDKPR